LWLGGGGWGGGGRGGGGGGGGVDAYFHGFPSIIYLMYAQKINKLES
jgi:hypothetical protein